MSAYRYARVATALGQQTKRIAREAAERIAAKPPISANVARTNQKMARRAKKESK